MLHSLLWTGGQSANQGSSGAAARVHTRGSNSARYSKVMVETFAEYKWLTESVEQWLTRPSSADILMAHAASRYKVSSLPLMHHKGLHSQCQACSCIVSPEIHASDYQ